MSRALRGMAQSTRGTAQALHAPADAGPCPAFCPAAKQTVRMVFK
jgi:hypothetical protein